MALALISSPCANWVSVLYREPMWLKCNLKVLESMFGESFSALP